MKVFENNLHKNKVFLFTKVVCRKIKHMQDQFRLFTVYIETTNETKRE